MEKLKAHATRLSSLAMAHKKVTAVIIAIVVLLIIIL